MSVILSYQPARDEQIDEFLELLQADAANYLRPTLEMMGWSWAEFASRVHGSGRVFCVYCGGEKVGCYWIEERGRVLHLHGIVVARAWQGQGIGTQVLAHLAEEYAGRLDLIELGVHESNPRAQALYEREGFVVVRHLAEPGFYIMQRALNQPKTAGLDALDGRAKT
ncbi:MAG: GNAT family N-acetyltransferase [Chloroflexota bacterium]|jgi:ribosomal protein S18 acetylase RimI-like enzyme